MEKKFTAQNFNAEVLQEEKPVLVDFYADWCGPCKMMAPVVEKLADKYDGKAFVGKLNIDEDASIAEQYNVMTIPTLAIFKGGKLVDKVIGVTPQQKLEEMLNSVL